LAQDLALSRAPEGSPLTEAEFRLLLSLADRYLGARGAFTSFLESIGRRVEAGIKVLPEHWKDELHTRARDALWWAFRKIVGSMDTEELHRPAARTRYRLFAATSGLVTGAAGMPGIVADLPASTLLILRAIADIARSHGYDLNRPDVQVACIEAFVFGGPTAEDDDADLAFWSTRAAAPMVSELVPQVAARLGASWSLSLPARAIPVVSSVTSAAINWHFSGYFQTMAEIIFGLKPLEERHGREHVRALFLDAVREMRALRQPGLPGHARRRARSA
jgi:hypothetical protein